MQYKKLPIFYRTLSSKPLSEKIQIIEDSSDDFLHLFIGFKHIAEQIFCYLDIQDLAKCRLVSRSWKEFIEDLKHWYISQLKFAYSKPMNFCKADGSFPEIRKLFLDQFPYWKSTFDFYGSKTVKLVNLKKFVYIMINYYQSEEPTNLCPIFNAILPKLNHEILTFFHEETPMDFNFVLSPGGGNLLQFACGLRFYDVVLFLIKGHKRKPVNMNLKLTGTFTRLVDAESAQVANFPAKKIEVAPLHLATIRLDVNIVQLLLDHALQLKIDINARTHLGQTPLHYALMGDKDKWKEVTSMVNLFFTHPVSRKIMDFNARDTKGNTAFHYACVQGLLPVIKLFLDQTEELGIDLNAQDIKGKTPLAAAKRNPLKIYEMELIVSYLQYHKLSEINLNVEE